MFRFRVPAAPALLLAGLSSLSLSAQTAKVEDGGNLSIRLSAHVLDLFQQQNITVTYLGTGPLRRGETFDVYDGKVDLQTGSGTALTRGSMSFTEGSNTVMLNQFSVSDRSANAFIVADVVVNGEDQGRFPVFQLVDDLYMAPLTYGSYSSDPVRFRINPDFQSEFADYIPIQCLDPNATLGNFQLDVTLAKKKGGGGTD